MSSWLILVLLLLGKPRRNAKMPKCITRFLNFNPQTAQCAQEHTPK